MKTGLALFIAACMISTTLCSCADKTEDDNLSTIPVSDCISGKLSLDDEQTSEKDIINKYKNLTAADNFTLSLPDGLTYISDFSYSSPKADSNKAFYDEFKETFDYIFADVEFDESAMFYEGDNSFPEYDENGEMTSYYKTVSEMYNKLMSDEENVIHVIYNDIFTQTENRAFMIFQSPMCVGGLSSFNRGEFDKIYNTADSTRHDLELSYPQLYLSSAQTLFPQSDKTVKLDGSDVKIADAVTFYESFLNSFPCPTDANISTRVAEVDIYPLENSEDCCIGFTTTIEYNHILFDYVSHGSVVPSEWSFVMGLGTMVKPDEVDSAYGIFRKLNITGEKKYDKMIPFDIAVKSVSENLTQNLTFEVLNACLVYSATAPESYEREKDIRTVTTTWKFELYNENDNKHYICYADAASGESFHYYTKGE